MPSLNTRLLSSIVVPHPPLPEQRAIAHVLGTLDDKIELNRRMNETLEAMARALFKSWFVDFDPVRAKMEGRDTGLPQDIADLFPDRLVDSEMGEIPEGWEVEFLGDLAKTRRRGIDPARMATDTPYIGLQHMPRRSGLGRGWHRLKQEICLRSWRHIVWEAQALFPQGGYRAGERALLYRYRRAERVDTEVVRLRAGLRLVICVRCPHKSDFHRHEDASNELAGDEHLRAVSANRCYRFRISARYVADVGTDRRECPRVPHPRRPPRHVAT